MAIIGRDDNNTYLHIGDYERRSGLYFGKPRMGRSWLPINLILQDIEKGYGVFFVDPHGDAIKDVIDYSTSNDILLLDPADRDRSFGINPLTCKDISDIRERDSAFNKAKGLFDRLWKDTFEEEPWLQMILQNTLHAFIENQGLTLIELPIFYKEARFRDYPVGNIRYNWQLRDYWNMTFASKSRRLQEEPMEAAQTRAEILLGHPFVSDIVGQVKNTLNFLGLIKQRKIILVHLSAALSYETKKIIGTLLISELLHAVEQRPADKREHFQTFAAYQDFSTLITQAPKYGVATTLAHHERYGQLGRSPDILGATAAIANKLLLATCYRNWYVYL